jgi:hypothetical protein
MSYEFTLVLNREITDEEARMIRDSVASDFTISQAVSETQDNPTTTQLDFKKDASSLEEAITAALEGVRSVPDLSAGSLIVPPYGGAEPAAEEPVPAHEGVAVAEGTVLSQAAPTTGDEPLNSV